MNRIKFTHSGHSGLVGNFSDGDTFVGDAEVCRHFVEDAGCAVWAEAPEGAVQTPAPEADKPTNASPAAAAHKGKRPR